MGLVLGMNLGGHITTTANLAKETAAYVASYRGNHFKRAVMAVKIAIPEQVTEATTLVAVAIKELAAEAAADGVAARFPEIHPNITTIVQQPNSKESCKLFFIYGYVELKRFIQDFLLIRDTYRNAAIRGTSAERKRKEDNSKVLDSIATKLEFLASWLNANSWESEAPLINIQPSYEPIELLDICVPLIAGMGNLKRLSDDVAEQNTQKRPMTDAQLDSFDRGITKVVATFIPLAWYMIGKNPLENIGNVDLFPIFIKPKDVLEWEKILQ